MGEYHHPEYACGRWSYPENKEEKILAELSEIKGMIRHGQANQSKELPRRKRTFPTRSRIKK